MNKKVNNSPPKKQRQAPIIVDTSFARAAQLVIANRNRAHLTLVGCGGTGSWLSPAIVRIARMVRDQDREATVTFVDPDFVEETNLYRQNFCQAELGRNKAVALASRYSAAWGIEIGARAERFTSTPRVDWNDVHVLIGCVDNAAGRKALSRALSANRGNDAPRLWWLDCGNSKEHGQVLLGSASTKNLEGAFPSPKLCQALPSPALQRPDLLKAQPEEQNEKRMSCAELVAANAQSLSINQRVAAEAADYLVRMLIGPALKKFATDIDLVTGSARSKAITPEEVNK